MSTKESIKTNDNIVLHTEHIVSSEISILCVIPQ